MFNVMVVILWVMGWGGDEGRGGFFFFIDLDILYML